MFVTKTCRQIKILFLNILNQDLDELIDFHRTGSNFNSVSAEGFGRLQLLRVGRSLTELHVDTTQNTKQFPSALASWCQTTTRPIAMDIMGLTKEVDFPLHFTRSSFWHNFLNWLKYSGQSGRIYHKKSKNVSATK